ncbi:hypothetical protein GCM10009840_15490 [Pseudolysinimonas kribbensis]|uniref:DUF6385 domain-containing protein n=2 Tax=Pseudolysinimonas kribbensis TaxID=433641 RepID=A0ABQ6K0G6_9MICO|nr:DUF6385 domain-containing protein [Pseudolysinimonas kribbensis]GMA94106.1 hypothetical protein GCM10025881_09300 [Pseudolysinimonas kribbensis]
MRQSQSAVIERGAELEQVLETEPFETAWAGEARWYVQFLRPAPGSTVEMRVQISPDGINWIDHESVSAVQSEAVGLLSIPVERFGHWLRLRVEQKAGQESPLLRIYLELKE